MEKIKIPQVDYGKQILIEDRGQELILFDNCCVLKSSGQWGIEIEDVGIKKRKFFDNIWCFDRNAAWTIDMCYDTQVKKYLIEIAQIVIVFGEQGEHPGTARGRCKELFDKIVKWKYGIEL